MRADCLLDLFDKNRLDYLKQHKPFEDDLFQDAVLAFTLYKVGDEFKFTNSYSFKIIKITKKYTKIECCNLNYSVETINIQNDYFIKYFYITSKKESIKKILRDIEGEFILDSINSINPFHIKSELKTKYIKYLKEYVNNW